jgi:hypothetical protein
MPINYKNYPENWRWLSRQIIKDADNKCELCYAPNGVKVLRGRSRLEQLPWYPYHSEYSEKGFRCVKIVLTVHHIDGDKKNSTKQNLIALCQRCHLRLDLEKHIKNRKRSKNCNGVDFLQDNL